jgi:hypothetical protein
MHLEGFQVVSSHFWALFVTGLTGQSVGPIQRLSTGLIGAVDWSDQLELSWVRIMCGSRAGGWSLPCVMSD